jgi:hypothetical protein
MVSVCAHLGVELNINLRVVLLPHVKCAKFMIAEEALEQRAQRVQAGSAWRSGNAQDENLSIFNVHALPSRSM